MRRAAAPTTCLKSIIHSDMLRSSVGGYGSKMPPPSSGHNAFSTACDACGSNYFQYCPASIRQTSPLQPTESQRASSKLHKCMQMQAIIAEEKSGLHGIMVCCRRLLTSFKLKWSLNCPKKDTSVSSSGVACDRPYATLISCRSPLSDRTLRRAFEGLSSVEILAWPDWRAVRGAFRVVCDRQSDCRKVLCEGCICVQ